MQYQIVETNDQKTVTIFYNDGSSDVVPASHPALDQIVSYLRGGGRDEAHLRRQVSALGEALKQLDYITERVSFQGRKLYFDGDRVKGPITKQIIRLVRADKADQAESVARFLEKLATNPSQYAREHLYHWLSTHDFTITEDGDFIAYKGVRTRDGVPSSLSRGVAFVNGAQHGTSESPTEIPNPLGAVVTMPRSRVDDGAHRHCSTGLHVGTFDFARCFAGHGSKALVAAVLINPRDVVSVPDDAEKLRVCRYQVLAYVTEAYAEPVLDKLPESLADELNDSRPYCEYCSEYGHVEADCEQAKADANEVGEEGPW